MLKTDSVTEWGALAGRAPAPHPAEVRPARPQSRREHSTCHSLGTFCGPAMKGCGPRLVELSAGTRHTREGHESGWKRHQGQHPAKWHDCSSWNRGDRAQVPAGPRVTEGKTGARGRAALPPHERLRGASGQSPLSPRDPLLSFSWDRLLPQGRGQEVPPGQQHWAWPPGPSCSGDWAPMPWSPSQSG